jgi:hypothetical protein
MYGSKDKTPMLNPKRRNKILKVLHYALEQEADKLISDNLNNRFHYLTTRYVIVICRK